VNQKDKAIMKIRKMMRIIESNESNNEKYVRTNKYGMYISNMRAYWKSFIADHIERVRVRVRVITNLSSQIIIHSFILKFKYLPNNYLNNLQEFRREKERESKREREIIS
jgi:hypothetical protein